MAQRQESVSWAEGVGEWGSHDLGCPLNVPVAEPHPLHPRFCQEMSLPPARGRGAIERGWASQDHPSSTRAIRCAASIFHPLLPEMQISPLLFILGFQIYGNLEIWREMPGPQRHPICLLPPTDSLSITRLMADV